MSPKEMGERVAVLEANNKTHHEWLEDVSVRLSSLDSKVGKILEAIAGNKGFFQGMVFTLTALGSILGVVMAKLWDSFVGGHS